jgi:hypothetical protein
MPKDKLKNLTLDFDEAVEGFTTIYALAPVDSVAVLDFIEELLDYLGEESLESELSLLLTQRSKEIWGQK